MNSKPCNSNTLGSLTDGCFRQPFAFRRHIKQKFYVFINLHSWKEIMDFIIKNFSSNSARLEMERKKIVLITKEPLVVQVNHKYDIWSWTIQSQHERVLPWLYQSIGVLHSSNVLMTCLENDCRSEQPINIECLVKHKISMTNFWVISRCLQHKHFILHERLTPHGGLRVVPHSPSQFCTDLGDLFH